MCRGSSRSCTRPTLAAIGDDRKDLWRMSDLYAVGAVLDHLAGSPARVAGKKCGWLKSLRAASSPMMRVGGMASDVGPEGIFELRPGDWWGGWR